MAARQADGDEAARIPVAQVVGASYRYAGSGGERVEAVVMLGDDGVAGLADPAAQLELVIGGVALRYCERSDESKRGD